MRRGPAPLRLALCLCVQITIAAGLVTETLACIITFTFYLRPSECLRLQGKLITAPAQTPRRVQASHGQMWSILLRPQEGADTSKFAAIMMSGCAFLGPTYAGLKLNPKQTPAGHMPAHVIMLVAGILAATE